jgi:transposase InsO family protein
MVLVPEGQHDQGTKCLGQRHPRGRPVGYGVIRAGVRTDARRMGLGGGAGPVDDRLWRVRRAARPETGWKPILQYALESWRWVGGDTLSLPLPHRSTLRSAMNRFL